MDTKALIKELGGPAKVARALTSPRRKGKSLTTAAVSKWDEIPEQYVQVLCGLSGDKYKPADIRSDIDWVHLNGRYYTPADEAA